MAATIYWRSDEENHSQVRSVNVPGVFPRPANKINSKTISAESKPWLQPHNMDNKRRIDKRESSKKRPVRDLSSKMLNAGIDELALETNLQVKESTKADEHKILSASLRDLKNEDKRRITNLIKELAKAGEERKTAVGALHKERNIFEERQKDLKLQQQQLVSERNELKERLLEYQFLVNQFSKQLENQKEDYKKELSTDKYQLESLPVLEMLDPQISQSGKCKQFTTILGSDNRAQGITDENLHLKDEFNQDSHNAMPTYYHISNSSSRIQKVNANRYETNNEESTQKNYEAGHKQSDFNTNNPIRTPDAALTNENQHPNDKENRSKTGDTMRDEKSDAELASSGREESFLSIPASLQNALLEQQNKLLEQQTQIQQQIEQLKVMQRTSNDELLKVLKPVENKSIDIPSCNDQQTYGKNTQSVASGLSNQMVNLQKLSPRGQLEDHMEKSNTSKDPVKQIPLAEYVENGSKHILYDEGATVDQLVIADKTKRQDSGVIQYHKNSSNFGRDFTSGAETHSIFRDIKCSDGLQNNNRNISQSLVPNTMRRSMYDSIATNSDRSLNSRFSRSAQSILKNESNFEKNDKHHLKSSMKKPNTTSGKGHGVVKWIEQTRQSSLLDVFDAIDDEVLLSGEMHSPYQSSFIESDKNIIFHHSKRFREDEFSSDLSDEYVQEDEESKVLSDVFYLKDF